MQEGSHNDWAVWLSARARLIITDYKLFIDKNRSNLFVSYMIRVHEI